MRVNNEFTKTLLLQPYVTLGQQEVFDSCMSFRIIPQTFDDLPFSNYTDQLQQPARQLVLKY